MQIYSFQNLELLKTTGSLLVVLVVMCGFLHNCAVMGVAFKLVSGNVRGIRSL